MVIFRFLLAAIGGLGVAMLMSISLEYGAKTIMSPSNVIFYMVWVGSTFAMVSSTLRGTLRNVFILLGITCLVAPVLAILNGMTGVDYQNAILVGAASVIFFVLAYLFRKRRYEIIKT